MQHALDEGISTVDSIARQFSELKTRATDLKQRLAASERGFFTPQEDEEVRHLHVSWWQSRNALFELICDFHRLERFSDDQRIAALLTAYTGALVLIDGARFLRDEFHDRPVVRRRLNNPDPQFDIPAGTYDRIQKSLTSPVHAWHLYHASRYLADHPGEIDAAEQTWPALNALRQIASSLQNRLDVSADRFVVARARVTARRLRVRLGPGLVGRAMYGIQKCVGRLIADRYVRAGHQPGLPPDVAGQLIERLHPGDVIVTRKNHSLTNYFLPGYWPHVALHIGTLDDLQSLQLDSHPDVRLHWDALQNCDAVRPQRVLEALKDGVRPRSLNSPFASDEIVILRPRLKVEDVANAIARAFTHAGKAYDFNFDFTRSDRMVCTEVVYRSFDGVGGIGFELTRRAGRLTLSAEDLIRMAQDHRGFEVEAVFSPTFDAHVTHGTAASELLRQTMNG